MGPCPCLYPGQNHWGKGEQSFEGGGVVVGPYFSNTHPMLSTWDRKKVASDKLPGRGWMMQ